MAKLYLENIDEFKSTCGYDLDNALADITKAFALNPELMTGKNLAGKSKITDLNMEWKEKLGMERSDSEGSDLGI